MRWIFFSPVVFILFGAICIYVGIKLLVFIRYFKPDVKTRLFWILFAVLCCMEILLIVFRSQFSFLRKYSSLWITVFLYIFILFALLVIVDIARLILYYKGKLPAKFNMYSIGGAIILCFGLIIYGASNARIIETVNYSITLDKRNRDIDFTELRIALVSDTHIGSSVGRRHIKRIADAINKVKPDIVCFTGDIFDGNVDAVKDMDSIITELKNIIAPLGMYACLGNHDYDRFDRIVSLLNSAGIVVLQDETFKITKEISIIGRKDIRLVGREGTRISASQLINSVKQDSGLIIMMDHRPAQFIQLENQGVDIFLSGHTHDGQIFPGTLFTHILFKRTGGISYGHWKGNTMHAFVTSGAGFWGPPIRIGTHSEVAVIDINIVQ